MDANVSLHKMSGLIGANLIEKLILASEMEGPKGLGFYSFEKILHENFLPNIMPKYFARITYKISRSFKPGSPEKYVLFFL
jgi:hypothetical protein